ncbi:2-oxoglutarate (2OG) and Fe(II)-dependent oxygenase superfamily protein [Artemisia annua]|uniref:2-oxoglutarate (2OG) and Fe(II)-dependent oxygenase superfamily protein n=1 Tax=Artemisia annua TaxID=35608 RepID=A0A2U1N603_ARTAN|nr:2-oxoglutarate (2OG) and Fe(II)-dependent oxygenase superfamily protein [Artemisia annua]
MINGAPVEEEDDPFLSGYNDADLRTVSEFLSNWLPFLSKGLCHHCSDSLVHRVHSLNRFEYASEQSHQEVEVHLSTPNHTDLKDETYIVDTEDTNSLGSWKDGAYGVSGHIEETSGSERVQSPEYFKTPTPRRSWADMAQEELEADEEEETREHFGNYNGRLQGKGEVRTAQKLELSREQRERIRFTNVTRKKDFICLERVNGKLVNILEGLELHYGVFSSPEQKRIVNFVYELQEKGKNGKLKERTFTAPQKWMRGKGRVTIQFGCCYNYATDRNGNPPGILRNELVDPIPHLFKVIIKRLVAWHVLPPTCVPDSCIVNIYDEGDCIPPHIDNHDFLRPFCTVSFLSECNILFGSKLEIQGPGEFSGSYKIPLPVGSVLVLNGNGADVAKHCVPAVPTKRISITFRKMDESKWPAGFHPEPDLQGLEPLVYESDTPKGGSSISKPQSQVSNRQAFRRDGFVAETDLRGLEPVAYESDRPKSSSSISKPHSHPSNRQGFRRDGFAPEPDLRGLERVSGSSISKPQSQFSNRQASRRDGFVAEPDLRRLEPVAYESDRPKSVSSISKPHIHPSNREPYRRDETRGLLGSQPRFYGQSQTRQQGPSPGYRRNGRLEY